MRCSLAPRTLNPKPLVLLFTPKGGPVYMRVADDLAGDRSAFFVLQR
jgi:hypothetical protein